jgi:hypothetical protein
MTFDRILETEWQQERSLGAIGIWASIGHGQDARSHVHQIKVFILEFAVIDAAPSSPIVICEVLHHYEAVVVRACMHTLIYACARLADSNVPGRDHLLSGTEMD